MDQNSQKPKHLIHYGNYHRIKEITANYRNKRFPNDDDSYEELSPSPPSSPIINMNNPIKPAPKIVQAPERSTDQYSQSQTVTIDHFDPYDREQECVQISGRFCELKFYVHVEVNRTAIQVFLIWCDCPGKIQSVHYEVSLLNYCGQKCLTKSLYSTYRNSTKPSKPFVFKKNIFNSPKAETLPKDKLIIQVHINKLNNKPLKITQTERETRFKPLNEHSVKLAKAFATPKYMDMYFAIHDDKYDAHKVVVAAQSPLFEKMLERHYVIQLDDVDPAVFQYILWFMYMGIVEQKGLSRFCNELKAAAEKYQITTLLTWCTNHQHKVTLALYPHYYAPEMAIQPVQSVIQKIKQKPKKSTPAKKVPKFNSHYYQAIKGNQIEVKN